MPCLTNSGIWKDQNDLKSWSTTDWTLMIGRALARCIMEASMPEINISIIVGRFEACHGLSPRQYVVKNQTNYSILQMINRMTWHQLSRWNNYHRLRLLILLAILLSKQVLSLIEMETKLICNTHKKRHINLVKKRITANLKQLHN